MGDLKKILKTAHLIFQACFSLATHTIQKYHNFAGKYMSITCIGIYHLYNITSVSTYVKAFRALNKLTHPSYMVLVFFAYKV